ncbi:ornithine carbamoyltransferase [Erythrobacter sp.]|uniref:ornithine carbamoyltransferase n=1 Tax=Erythrobacter sp. TaxID=1042 RepID=UPI003C773B9E
MSMKGMSLLTLEEFSGDQITQLIDRAIELKNLKQARKFPKNLENRNFCLVFLKPSTRTRTSFVVASCDEGAHLEIFGHEDIRFGIKESVKDIARVMGRMFDGIAFRGYDHSVVEDLARYSGVPVWNGLSDDHHPTQALADLMSLKEEFGEIRGRKLAFVGDGSSNVVRSLVIAGAKTGLDFRVVSPTELQPDRATIEPYLTAADPDFRLTITEDVTEGVAGCDAIYGDIWLSMGEEHLVKHRIEILEPYRIDEAMFAKTGNAKAIFLHCLPALHDDETEFAKSHPGVIDVTDDVFEGARSRVFDQSENRMHTIKAIMVETV